MALKDKIEIVFADITKEETDAIVNAANKYLSNKGGVALAIRKAAGQNYQDACNEINAAGGCPIGYAVITPGFDLSADYVINTVGPKHGVDPQNQAQQLANCYYRSLQVAADNNLKSVSFPAISCGVYGYPVAEAADLAIKGLIQGLKDFPSIEKVRICFFNDPRAVDNIQETFAQALDEN